MSYPPMENSLRKTRPLILDDKEGRVRILAGMCSDIFEHLLHTTVPFGKIQKSKKESDFKELKVQCG